MGRVQTSAPVFGAKAKKPETPQTKTYLMTANFKPLKKKSATREEVLAHSKAQTQKFVDKLNRWIEKNKLTDQVKIQNVMYALGVVVLDAPTSLEAKLRALPGVGAMMENGPVHLIQ